MDNSTTSPLSGGGGARRILVADDDTYLAMFIKELMKREGHEVTVVGSGQDVLEKVHERAPDLLLLDMMMPGMNGLDVLRALRRDAKAPFIRVMVMSALSDREHILATFDEGADDYLCKPFKPEELTLRVQHLLAQGRENTEAGDAEEVEALFHELMLFQGRLLKEAASSGMEAKRVEEWRKRIHAVASGLKTIAADRLLLPRDLTRFRRELRVMRQALGNDLEGGD